MSQPTRISTMSRPTAVSNLSSRTNASTNLRPLQPLRTFPNIEEFVRRHKEGTEAEFATEQKRVDAINKEQHKFKAWVLLKTRQTAKRSEYLVVVDPGAESERKIAQQGEPARLRIVFNDGSVTRFFDARRVETRMALLRKTAATARNPEKIAAYQVTVHIADAHEGVKPLITNSDNPGKRSKHDDSNSAARGSPDGSSSDASTSHSASIASNPDTPITIPESSECNSEVMLTDDNAVGVNFLLTASESTKNAELGAVNLLYGKHANATERQIHAFEYFVLLRNAQFEVNLLECIPHMISAMTEPSWPDSLLGKKFQRLNFAQKHAYLYGFQRLPCGICILPGGPGAGKTHFNLFTIAMAQSRPLPTPVSVKNQPEKRCAKVLFIVDMNSPVDDVANRAVRLYQELGMKKSVIRMKGWGTEVALSDRLNAAEDAASGDPITVDFTNQFLRTANLMLGHGSSTSTRACNAPSLDEAAWQRYDEYKSTQYEELTKFLEGELWEESEIIPLRFRRCVYNLYRDTLAAADFIATTPVAASNHFRGLFKPDLVFFDESPHARELCNLIAIANFNPIAWIFCGDYRQTVPYVGSDTPGCTNIYRDQMRISMMERAAAADNAIQHELFINHRAFGGLEQLASRMWYGSRMRSGNVNKRPASLSYIETYLERYMGGKSCTVPRLLVHIKDCGPERRDGTSAWNPTHTAWVMAQVRGLINDKRFQHTERDGPGTILIISPYKKAFQEYKNAIKKLPHWAQRRVETRTVDVVQGHEADFVFLDLVKDNSTQFLDNPNRLCVAITRARQGEIIMMHPNMVQSTSFKSSRNLRPIYDICAEEGQVVFVSAVGVTGEGLAGSIHSSATSTTSVIDQPTSVHPPATIPKGLAGSIHARTASTTSVTGQAASAPPVATIPPTIGVTGESTSPAQPVKDTPTVGDNDLGPKPDTRPSKNVSRISRDSADWQSDISSTRPSFPEFYVDRVVPSVAVETEVAGGPEKNEGMGEENEGVGEKNEGVKEPNEGVERVLTSGVVSTAARWVQSVSQKTEESCKEHPWARPPSLRNCRRAWSSL
ncbi:P-loop containing nucleoside triphosphate hydrolase protein [Achaetomium macrosporum]|uniref:P-loop containing nucleoside triphosphate hydrolase protein n=1 Tax=Achaetomium macrosporum TaxID=79813 RepID=A0AAN7C2Y4_9PEZI|nr:P-loop containing nucleoside triphosphate hydrolase protein [Achaetomium macrosporum]